MQTNLMSAASIQITIPILTSLWVQNTKQKLPVFESNDDGDVIDNDKKTVGLDWQNNNFGVPTSRFFVHFFAVTARLRRENT